MSKSPPIRYAIYTRQSVEKLADFSSCQAQFNTCQDFVAALNDPFLHWCGQHFDDEGQSGSTLDWGGSMLAPRVTFPKKWSRTLGLSLLTGGAGFTAGSLPVPAVFSN